MTTAKHYVLPLVPTEDSVALLFSEDLLSRLHVGVGDTICLRERPDGSLLLSAQAPDSEAQLREAQDTMATRSTYCGNWPIDGGSCV